ncbi:MAG: TM0106 family RecB-like putative nuclease [Potamolinea sp.]
MLLKDELLLYYKRCRRRAFLDIYGDYTQQEREQDFLLKLRQDSRTHQQAVLSAAPHYSPYYPRHDWQAGAQATLELMQQGIERISKAVLLMPISDEITLLSTPDLLVKQPGKSVFGDWMYAPTNIRLGRRPKPEYQMVAAFSAYLLTEVQQVVPNTAWLILRSQDSYTVNLERWLPQMQVILAECIDTLLLYQEPEVFISRQKCGLCQWYNSCYAIAQSQEHLSLLPGVTPSRYRDLQTLGLTTVASIAEAEITTLEPTFGDAIASDLVQQAQSTVQKRALLRQTYIPELPDAPVELYFDIEAEPELQLDYLLGLLVVDKRTDTERFHPFLAEHPSEEGLIWQDFLDFVELYPDAPIFHYSDYEAETIKRLGQLYNTPNWQVKQLLSRFVDVHQRVMSSVTLPVQSYSLKSLARWLGFEWRDPNVTGSQCVCLYDSWLKSGDRSHLNFILRYNEDDCRATYLLKNWLADFLHNNLHISI